MTGYVNPFTGIEKAPPSTGGAYTLKGKHLVLLGGTKYIEGQKRCFVQEYDIIRSDNPECTPGQRRSWVVNLAHQPAMSNIRTMVAEMLSEAPNGGPSIFDHVDGAIVNGTTQAAQPLKGRVALMDCVEILTKEAKKPFTKARWEFVAMSLDEAVAKGKVTASEAAKVLGAANGSDG